MSEVGLPSQARPSNLNTTTQLCVMLVHALSLYYPLAAECYAAINMPHPPQYGVTPAIIGELIALNSQGGRALELCMHKKKACVQLRLLSAGLCGQHSYICFEFVP